MDAIKLYDQLIDKNPAIERKGKTTPYTSINGHMFSFLSKEGEMGLRLSEKDRLEFMDRYKAKVMEQHGRTMKEYVHVPSELMSNPDQMVEYLEKSLEFVSSLKPKPSKKKK